MPALSTSTIAASDGASKAAAKPGARGGDKSADGSPFASLLAATSQQSEPRKPQAVAKTAANNNDTPAAKKIDPQARTAQTAPQSLPRTHGDNIVSKDSGKQDKKTDDAKGPDAVAQEPPVQTAAAPISVQTSVQMSVQGNVQVNAQPVAQVNSPTPGTAEDDSSLDAIEAASSGIPNSGGSVAQAGNVNSDSAGNKPVAAVPADPQPVSPPVPASGQSGPVAQSPTPAQQIADTGDNNVAANDAAPSVPVVIKSDRPVAQNKTGDSKAAADKAANPKSASNPPVDLQTVSQPAPATDDDVAPAAQTVAIAPPVGANPIASNSGADAATTAQLANTAPAQVGKSDAKDTGAATKPAQTAANTNTSSPAINTPSPAMPATAVPGKVSANETDSVQTASSGNNDSKPAHVSLSDAAPQPQPDAPAPIPQAAPAPVMPQGMATAAFGAAAPASGTDGGTVTSSVHIAAADADPTPTLGALAVSVAARALSGAKQFDIRLDPPELGRVDVRLSIDASGKTEAHMTADQPQTLSLLQKDAPTLTLALRDAGLDVSQSGLNFSLRGQDRQNDGAEAGRGRRTNLTATRAIQAAQSPTAISFNGAAADARVDIHV